MILTIYTATTMIIIAYLLGSIPSAVWIGKKYYGIDIREHGSKNAGTTNMLRVLGRRAALPVFALDFLKGFVAVTIIELMQYDDLIGQNDLINLKIVAVFAAVLGHIFPIFAGFRGGKGVATLVGAVTGIYPRGAAVLRRVAGDTDGLALRVAGLDGRRMLLPRLHPHIAQSQRIDGFRGVLVRDRHPADLHPPQEHRTAEGGNRVEDLHLEAAARETRRRGAEKERQRARSGITGSGLFDEIIHIKDKSCGRHTAK